MKKCLVRHKTLVLAPEEAPKLSHVRQLKSLHADPKLKLRAILSDFLSSLIADHADHTCLTEMLIQNSFHEI